MILLRGNLHPVISFVAANILVCIGYTLILAGIGKLCGKEIAWKWLVLSCVVYSLEFAYFFLVDDSFKVRLFFYLVYYAAVMMASMWIVIHAYRRIRLLSHLVAALFFGLLSLSFLVIAVLSQSQSGVTQIMSPSAINAAVVLEQTIFVVGWTFAFTLIVSERLSAERLRAEATSREKSDALANMSHELRTPLNAIIGFADVIDKEALGANHPRYREYVQDILASGRHLLLLIEDILDISKIEAGKLELDETTFPVSSTIEIVHTMVMLKAATKKVDMVLEIDRHFDRMRGDERRVRQILLNLVTNAIKFTPAGGRVTLSARLAPDGGGVFTVADTGIGMDEAGQRRALTKYCQVTDSSIRQQEGIGLGLPLAVALTLAHGGDLKIDSIPGKGTTITVTFPAERCRQEMPA
ncbi:sensor histidine kinase [Paramagnetospirillum marisnigri]|nr:ATP-binding protein [Paramagnetospirillum marisnigri]